MICSLHSIKKPWRAGDHHSLISQNAIKNPESKISKKKILMTGDSRYQTLDSLRRPSMHISSRYAAGSNISKRSKSIVSILPHWIWWEYKIERWHSSRVKKWRDSSHRYHERPSSEKETMPYLCVSTRLDCVYRSSQRWVETMSISRHSNSLYEENEANSELSTSPMMLVMLYQRISVPEMTTSPLFLSATTSQRRISTLPYSQIVPYDSRDSLLLIWSRITDSRQEYSKIYMHILYDILLLRHCWQMVLTSVLYRNSWDMPRSQRLKSIRMSPIQNSRRLIKNIISNLWIVLSAPHVHVDLRKMLHFFQILHSREPLCSSHLFAQLIRLDGF